MILAETSNGVVIVHWDGVRLLTRRLSVSGSAVLENAAFSPIEAQP